MSSYAKIKVETVNRATSSPINQSYELRDKSRWVIGRSSGCDIVINNPGVSRFHCTIVITKQKEETPEYLIIDGLLGKGEGSRFGVWKNGKAVRAMVIRNNDKFQIAKDTFIELEVPDPTTPPEEYDDNKRTIY